MATEQPDWRSLLNINLGFWGAQVGNGLQTANASAIFESLGADASLLPLLWLGAPLTGLIAQPIVGNLSDRTWSRWGRRQPYFLAGALLTTVMLLLLPQANRLWQAVAMYWLLQLGLNIGIAPARPFIGDLLPPLLRTLGYAVQGFCIALGAIVASILPWLLETVFSLESAGEGVPAAITGAYVVGAVLLLVGTLWTFWSVDEVPPEEQVSSEAMASEIPEAAQDSSNQPSALTAIAQAITTMPLIMRRLAAVQVLTWIGVYLIFLYLPTAIAMNILGVADRQSPSYAHGVEWAGVCIAFYNLVCLGTSLLIPNLSRWWGRSTLHALCLMCGAVGLVSLLLIHSRYPILLSMVGVGIAWASILSIPYALLMDDLSKHQSGVYMGLFNGFVTLPQIILSLGFGWFMDTYLQENRLWALALGGLFWALAAIAMVWVPESTARSAGTETANDRDLAIAQD